METSSNDQLTISYTRNPLAELTRYIKGVCKISAVKQLCPSNLSFLEVVESREGAIQLLIENLKYSAALTRKPENTKFT